MEKQKEMWDGEKKSETPLTDWKIIEFQPLNPCSVSG